MQSLIHPYPFYIRVLPMPIPWGWQHQVILNTGSPCISGIWVNSSQATNTDIGLHTFRPCYFRPSSPSSPSNQKVCDRFDTGCGTLYKSIQSDPPNVKACRNIRQVFVVVNLMVFVLVYGVKDLMDHGTVILMDLLQVGGVWSPRFATMVHDKSEKTGLVHLATYLRWEMSGG